MGLFGYEVEHFGTGMSVVYSNVVLSLYTGQCDVQTNV